jgi:folylpolyglutamate synthase
LEKYLLPGEDVAQVALGLQGDHQRTNAALAIALSNTWLASSKYARKEHKNPNYSPQANNYSVLITPLSQATRVGLALCKWPGRAQVLEVPDTTNLTLFLDGAHTPESMQVCAEWFANREKHTQSKDIIKVLVFHCGSGRDPAALLGPVVSNAGVFDKVFFTTFLVYPPAAATTTVLVRNKADNDPKWQQHVAETWNRVGSAHNPSPSTSTADPPSPLTEVELFPSITDTINKLKNLAHSQPHKRVHVLVTGSLYLVGGVLEVVKYPIC